MPELKPFKCVAHMEEGKPKGYMIGGRPGKDHVWIHKSCVKSREKLLVDTLEACTKRLLMLEQGDYSAAYVDARNLLSDLGKEEHQ